MNQGASPREVLGEVEAQPRLSREDKGKTPLNVGSVTHASREAELEPRRREFPLASPNQRALVSNAKSAPLSEVKGVSLSAGSVTYTALALKGTNKVPSHELKLKHYAMLITFAVTQRSKHHSVLKAKLPWLHFIFLLALSSHLRAELKLSCAKRS